jgi:Zn-dependent M28 family amino/carboxypeptidase
MVGSLLALQFRCLRFLLSLAWVLGSADPTSGTASMHETIRGLGELLRKGWKPLRTIVIASWDAEEVSFSLHLPHLSLTP